MLQRHHYHSKLIFHQLWPRWCQRTKDMKYSHLGGQQKLVTSPSFVSSPNFLRVYLFWSSRSISWAVEQHWSYVQPSGTAPGPGLQLLFVTLVTALVFSPPHCPLTQPAIHPFVYDNVMRDSVKSLYGTQNEQTSTALPKSTKWVILPEQTSRLVSAVSFLAILFSTYFNSN